nr:ammonium transporter [Sphingomonas psychrotolerans]
MMRKELVPALIWAGGIILLALAATVARRQGYIDQDTVLRLVIGVNGLMIAYYGNRAPKAVAPSACAARIARVAGWSLVLSGLVYVGLWAFAPIPVAIAGGTAAVLTGMLVTLAYCLRSRAQDLGRTI